MATKADILITAKDKASKVIKTVEDSLHGVGRAGKAVTPDLVTLRQEWGFQVSTMLQAGQSMEAVATATGLTREQVRALAADLRVTTEAVEEQGRSLIRTPQYFAGFRGGWLNMITSMAMGIGVMTLAHKAIEKLIEPLTTSNQRLKDFHVSLAVFIPDVEEYAKRAREAEKETFNWGELLRATALEMTGLNEVLDVDRIRTHQLAVQDAFEAIKALSEEGLSVAAKRFEEQRQEILETSGSTEEYTQRILALINVSRELYMEIDKDTRATFEFGMAEEFAAEAGRKWAAVLDRLGAIFTGLGGTLEDVGDIQDTYADRTGDITFRAGQAWESYTFRVGQTVNASNFRLIQAQDKFNFAWTQRQEKAQHAAASRGARAQATAEATMARHRLTIESINQDHYDKLEDMEKKHQEEMRRFLQKAPWYLQREVRDYQKQKKTLEERGDKAGLARLKRAFMERLRAIDPVYAEELERLEDLQKDERNVEGREFKQRLDRERKRFGIGRRLRDIQNAIALADIRYALEKQNEAAVFAYNQWLKAQEFGQQQRLDSMKFAYGQQATASGRAMGEAGRDYQRALDDWGRTFANWARAQAGDYYRWFRHFGAEGVRGLSETSPVPSGYQPRGRGYQMGLPYVPTTMPVVVHTGEAILRKEQAAAWRGGRGGGDIIIQFYGPVYMRTRQEVRELAHEISREMGRKVYARR